VIEIHAVIMILSSNVGKNKIGYLIAFIGVVAIVTSLFLVWPRLTTTESTVFVPARIKGLPAGLTIVGPSVNGVEFSIRGPESLIRKVNPDTMACVFDLSLAKKGSMSLPVLPDEALFPAGITVLRVSPSLVTFKIEHEIETNVPVTLVVSGEPMPGFRVRRLKTTPAALRLRGPESVLAPMASVKTVPVELNGIAESFKKVTALDLPEGVDILSDQKIVLVEVSIDEKTALRTLTDIPIAVRGAGFEYAMDPANLTLSIAGPERFFQDIALMEAIDVYVDLAGYSPGRHAVRAVVNLPVELTLLDITPESFVVNIYNQPRLKE
jgi:YbbR domain-containing protein